MKMINNPFRTEVLLSNEELLQEMINRAVIMETVYTGAATDTNKKAFFDILLQIRKAALQLSIQAEVIIKTYK